MEQTQKHESPEPGSEDEMLEELAHNCFRAMMHTYLTLKDKKHRTFEAVAQSLGSMIGLVYANAGHLRCAADTGTVVRDMAIAIAGAAPEEREALFQSCINELNAMAGSNEPTPTIILPPKRNLQ